MKAGELETVIRNCGDDLENQVEELAYVRNCLDEEFQKEIVPANICEWPPIPGGLLRIVTEIKEVVSGIAGELADISRTLPASLHQAYPRTSALTQIRQEGERLCKRVTKLTTLANSRRQST